MNLTEWHKLKGRITELERKQDEDSKAIAELKRQMVNLMSQMACRQSGELTETMRKPGRPRKDDGSRTVSSG